MPELTVQLAGGYPLAQVDRLMRNLEPLIHLEEPHLVALDMGALVNVCPTSLALLTAVAVQLTQKRLLEPGSMVLPPRSPLTRNYLMRMDLLKQPFPSPRRRTRVPIKLQRPMNPKPRGRRYALACYHVHHRVPKHHYILSPFLRVEPCW